MTLDSRSRQPVDIRTDAAAVNGTLLEFKRFVIVGIINTAVDLGVLNALILLSGTGHSGFSYSVLKTISFTVALANSYYLNRTWTFRTRPVQKSTVRTAGQFVFISVLGAVINVGTASYIATMVTPSYGLEKYWPSVAALAGASCGFLWNFVGYRYIVFSAGDHAGEYGGILQLGLATLQFGRTAADEFAPRIPLGGETPERVG